MTPTLAESLMVFVLVLAGALLILTLALIIAGACRAHLVRWGVWS